MAPKEMAQKNTIDAQKGTLEEKRKQKTSS